MNRDAVMLGTIDVEELPLHFEVHQSLQHVLPSNIEEDENDFRSLLYLLNDNDFERAASMWTAQDALYQACVKAEQEALLEAEAQRNYTRDLAELLEQLMEDDDDLIDMLGRRILATNGYQIPDLWHSQHQHHHHHPHHHHHRHHPRHHGRDPRQVSDVEAAWNDFEARSDWPAYSFADPFIHAAPIVIRGHAPHRPTVARPAAESSHMPVASSSKARAQTRTRVAVHPLTGVPLLLVEEEADDREGYPQDEDAATEYDNRDDDDRADEWPIDDESDIDWLGRELVHRLGGANVWVLGAGGHTESPQQDIAPSAAEASSSQSASKASLAVTSEQKPDSASATLPTAVEEVDSDHEPAHAATFSSTANQGLSDFNNASQRVAAALARAALHSPSGEKRGSSATEPARRQRAATVMSESEEEELETVGRPVEAEPAEEYASSPNDRPRKSFKVADLRTAK